MALLPAAASAAANALNTPAVPDPAAVSPADTSATATNPPPSASAIVPPTSSPASLATTSATTPAASLSRVSTPDTPTSSVPVTSGTPLSVSQTLASAPTASVPTLSAPTSTFSTFTPLSSPPTNIVGVGAGPQTQTQTTTQTFSASSTPSGPPLSNLAANSSPSFFQNTAAMAGVFSAVGVVVLLVLIYFTTRIVRGRRQRLLDSELDAVSFVPDSHHGHGSDDYAAPRRGPSPVPSTSEQEGYGAGGYGGYYTQPPLAHQQPQYNYGGQFDYAASGEYYAGAGGAAVAGVGPPPPAVRRGEPAPFIAGGPQMAQAQQYGASLQRQPSQPQQQQQPSRNYTPPSVSASAETSEMALPNPHGALKVANEY